MKGVSDVKIIHSHFSSDQLEIATNPIKTQVVLLFSTTCFDLKDRNQVENKNKGIYIYTVLHKTVHMYVYVYIYFYSCVHPDDNSLGRSL
jgi:hypothetical protein